ncbi:hypothetical protein C0585_06350 [Candidatus Woesearchaeota archaeon]|nr:MAG: hypothetical protein C0585_06350 [Candidatus Woesearchaeota archaeon]
MNTPQNNTMEPFSLENNQTPQRPKELDNDVVDNQPNLDSNQSQNDNPNELPSFENDSFSADNDLIVPTPPPKLLERKKPDLSMEHLEKVEEEFLRTRIPSLDEYKYEKKTVDFHKPIFIKVKNYEITLKNIIDIKTSVKEFGEIFFRLENLYDSQNTKFKNFHNMIEDMQRKLIYVDNTIFEG